ncbi:MAG: cytochrome b N-terminal domain-containing protein [Thermodesulfobacteriota bacterium]
MENIKEKSLKDKVIDLVQEDVPDHLHFWPYSLGAIPLVLFLILAVTGILMTFYYIPHPEKAYDSVREITYGIYLGYFIRGLHKVAVNFMVLFLLFHIVRVFFTRGYSGGGAVKWVMGALVFFTTLALGFTGYSLVYDNVSYWGTVVVTTMAGEVPLVGKPLLYLLRGGEEISEITLLRLYDLHTKLLPLLIVLLIGAHIAATRLVGFAKVEGLGGEHPFWPDHAVKVGVITLGLLIIMVNLVLIFPPGLGEMADPVLVAEDVSPPWYFSASYQWIIIAPREPALFVMLIFPVLFICYPWIDSFLEGRGYEMAKVNMAVGTVVIVAFLWLTLWEIF